MGAQVGDLPCQWQTTHTSCVKTRRGRCDNSDTEPERSSGFNTESLSNKCLPFVQWINFVFLPIDLQEGFSQNKT